MAFVATMLWNAGHNNHLILQYSKILDQLYKKIFSLLYVGDTELITFINCANPISRKFNLIINIYTTPG